MFKITHFVMIESISTQPMKNKLMFIRSKMIITFYYVKLDQSVSNDILCMKEIWPDSSSELFNDHSYENSYDHSCDQSYESYKDKVSDSSYSNYIELSLIKLRG